MPRKRLKGVVVKKSGDKTYKIEVVYTRQHPKYRKIIHIRRRFLAHYEGELPIGVEVIIEESRRISKLKHFKVVEVLNNMETDNKNA